MAKSCLPYHPSQVPLWNIISKPLILNGFLMMGCWWCKSLLNKRFSSWLREGAKAPLPLPLITP